MSFINFATREVNFKIVYYGPSSSGKTTSLKYIYEKTNPENRAKTTSYSTEIQKVLFFDFSPRNLELRGFKVRLHLYTLSQLGQFEEWRRIFAGVDGIVFVADSRLEFIHRNFDSLLNLSQYLESYSKKLSDIPIVLQYNKRDIPEVLSIDEMDQELRIYPWDRFESVATQGLNVFLSVKELTRSIIKKFKSDNWKA